jgi:hypothetical protein
MITSFFRDLTSIHEQTMKYYIIINAFKQLEIWPLSAKAGLKKIRAYKKKKRLINEVIKKGELELPALPPTRPPKIWNIITTIQALRDRDPTQFSKGGVQTFYSTLKTIDIIL